MIFNVSLTKLFSKKALLFMAFFVLGQPEELEETLPHVLKCFIDKLVIQQCLQDGLGLKQQ